MSADSLLCTENKDDNINNVDTCFEIQCNQVFIGMVTMQYQAQTDMVIHFVINMEFMIEYRRSHRTCLIGTIDRATRQSLHPIRSLQQRERIKIARIFGENGTGKRVELPHIVAQ